MKEAMNRVLAILLITFVLAGSSTIPDAGSSNADESIPDAFLSFFVEGADPEEGSIEGPSVFSSKNIRIGFSDGTNIREVVDPEQGSPMIPWISTVMETRYEIDNIRFKSREKINARVPEDIRTIPAPSSHWGDADPYGSWENGEIYPREQVRIDPIGYRHRGGDIFRVYSVWFSPLKLEGNSCTLTLGGDAELDLSEEEVSPGPTRAQGDPAEIPGTLSVTDTMDIPPEYLIITDTENVDELSVLAEWRNRKGLATSVVDINRITDNYTGSEDDADLLREYIKDVKNGWDRLEYVLLAGDWDTVPAKKVLDSEPSGWDDGWIPADSYFQCLDGTWDLDGDGIFGEPGDLEDIIPDIVVSRLAINDGDVWEEKIQQIIDYEKGDELGAWSDTSVLLGANTHSEGDGSHFSRYLRDKYLNEAYQTMDEQYEDQQTLSHSSVDQSLKDGSTFVQFVDHGGPNEWCDDYGAGVIYRSRDARSLANGVRLPFISALACLTTWFDDTSGCPYGNWENCLGESFTENTEGGAIGYVGSSRVSVGIINTNRYLPYDNGLIEDIARQIGGMKNYVLGDVHTNGKTHYAEVWGGQFESGSEVSLTWMEFTLLGEPAVDLWTGGTGKLKCKVDHEDDLDPHISVTVTDQSGEPVPDANVSLQNFQRKVFQKATTDSDGKAVFDLVLDWFCDINLTVTKHDMVPFTGFIRITDVIPPVTEMLTDPPEPDGENGWYREQPTIRFVPNERGVVHYRIGSSNNRILNGSANYTLPPLPEGENTIHYFAEDEAGNLEVERHDIVRIDIGDPELGYVISPEFPDGNDGWYATEPMIRINESGDDGGSPVDHLIDIDGEEFLYTVPFFVPEGKHRVSMKAIDRSGRESNITTIDMKVDITPPSTSMEVSPVIPDGDNGWYRSAPRVTLIPLESDCIVEYRTSPRDDFSVFEDELLLEDGIYDLEYRSVDRAGNIGSLSRKHFMVDTGPPSIHYDMFPRRPDGENGWYVSRPSLTLGWQDEQGAVIMSSLDGGSFEEWIGKSKLDDGINRIEAYTIDDAGHRSQMLEIEVKVDTTLPSTSERITGARNNGWYTSVPTITLDRSEEGATFYSLDGHENIFYDSPFSPDKREGTVTLDYYTVDLAGNREDTRSVDIRIDTVKPDPKLDHRVGDDGRVYLSAKGSLDGTEVRYRFSVDGNVVRDWSTEDETTLELEPGTYTVTVDVTDSAGNTASRSGTVHISGPDYIPIMIGGTLILVAIIVIAGILMTGRSRRYGKDHLR